MMKKSLSRKIFEVCNVVLMLLICVATMYPLLNQLALSLSSSSGIMNNTVYLLPVDLSFKSYTDILRDSAFWGNYKNTIVYTVVATSIAIFMTSTCAYALSKEGVIGSSVILKCMLFTMFFGGGLIPTFALIRTLGLVDTMWAITIPGAIAPYNMLLMRTYFKSLPSDLEDAAAIDGLSQLGYFWRIAVPLSKPIFSTITLFISVANWNEWFPALIYLNDSDAYPITLYLRNVMMGSISAATDTNLIESATDYVVPQSTQATSMILVILPIMCIYPFVQKYFVKGIMIGSIKG